MGSGMKKEVLTIFREFLNDVLRIISDKEHNCHSYLFIVFLQCLQL